MCTWCSVYGPCHNEFVDKDSERSRRQSDNQSRCWRERFQKTLEDTPRNLSVIVRVWLRVLSSSDNSTVSPFMR